MRVQQVEHLRVTSPAGFDPEGQLAQLPSWGDLYQIHPFVPEPLEVPQALALAPEQQARLVKHSQKSSKPCPICIKRFQFKPFTDYLSFNILLSENQVVGVLISSLPQEICGSWTTFVA